MKNWKWKEYLVKLKGIGSLGRKDLRIRLSLKRRGNNDGRLFGFRKGYNTRSLSFFLTLMMMIVAFWWEEKRREFEVEIKIGEERDEWILGGFNYLLLWLLSSSGGGNHHCSGGFVTHSDGFCDGGYTNGNGSDGFVLNCCFALIL